MDREKLNEVAKEYASMETEDYGDIDERTTAYNNCIYGFKAGVQWLLSQPLSERMTEEEKAKICNLYHGSKSFIEDKRCYWFMQLILLSTISLLESIFGPTLFNPQNEQYDKEKQTP